MQLKKKSLGFVAVIKAMVAGEMDPKYAVDLFREQISKPGQQTSGKYWGTGGIPGANQG